MPAPITPPMPSITRLNADRERFRERFSGSPAACTASCIRTAVDFRAQISGKTGSVLPACWRPSAIARS